MQPTSPQTNVLRLGRSAAPLVVVLSLGGCGPSGVVDTYLSARIAEHEVETDAVDASRRFRISLRDWRVIDTTELSALVPLDGSGDTLRILVELEGAGCEVEAAPQTQQVSQIPIHPRDRPPEGTLPYRVRLWRGNPERDWWDRWEYYGMPVHSQLDIVPSRRAGWVHLSLAATLHDNDWMWMEADVQVVPPEPRRPVHGGPGPVD